MPDSPNRPRPCAISRPRRVRERPPPLRRARCRWDSVSSPSRSALPPSLARNKMSIRRIAAALVVIAALLGRPGFAFAHATPVTYEPAASSVLTDAPSAVAIIFSERVEAAASSIIVYGPDGGRVEEGDAVAGDSEPRVFSVPVRAAAEGTYTVSWQVVSADDGHFTKGAFAFSLGKETTPAIAAAQGFQISH